MNAHESVTIVMIEDDEGHARLIEKNIRRAGIMNEIRHFTDGGTALDYLFNDASGPALNGPAMILLDLNLPDMSGIDILAKVKAEGSPVIPGNGPAISSVAPASSSRWRIVSRSPAITASMSSVSGESVRLPCRDSFRIALMSRSIFSVEVRMKPIASGRSTRAASRAAGVTTSGAAASARSISSASGPVAASSSAVKPMTFTSGERRSWLTI